LKRFTYFSLLVVALLKQFNRADSTLDSIRFVHYIARYV